MNIIPKIVLIELNSSEFFLLLYQKDSQEQIVKLCIASNWQSASRIFEGCD